MARCLPLTFFPVAVETAGTWNQSAIELIQETGRRITAATEDTRETVFLLQRLSTALQRGNAITLTLALDCLHGLLPGPFLLSYSVFDFIFFS